MLTIVFDHDSKEEALSFRDKLCSALVGVPGFVNNDIIVNTQDIDKESLQPLNEEGNLVVTDKDGIKYEHCVRLVINSPEQPKDALEYELFLKKKPE